MDCEETLKPHDIAEQVVDGSSSVPQELVDFIVHSSDFIIAGHKEPDGDCVGCQLALRSALLRLGKNAVVCSAGPFKRSELRGYECHFEKNPAMPENSKVIIVDCSNIERTGEIKNYIEKFPYAIIDHHASGGAPSPNHLHEGSVYFPVSTPQEPVYVDSNAPSCTLIIYKVIKALGLELTKEEANLLFFGLCTDTGYFRFLTEQNYDVFSAASDFVKRGANPKKIFNSIYNGRTLSSRIMTGRILSRIESHFDGKLLLSYATLDDFETFGLAGRDSETLNQLMLSVEGVKAAVTIRQECADYCTVSLRSTNKINVAQIAFELGGGGHKNASGLTMKGDITSVKLILLNVFKNVFTV